ncbi:response regulator [Primorskyibacter sp. 2E233]|uniref:response regulator n=1 Tax=Primorskyibacter sp. 2E233 TaxID=3413431 RepID=UPI003BF11672
MKLLVVEDDPFHAQFMLDTIARALPDVTEITHVVDGAEGEAEFLSGGYLAVVLDLQMPRRNGVEAARAIWASRPETRILFWSNYADEAYLRGITKIVPEESAYGYVLKTASVSQLELALRAVLMEGQIMVDREVHRLQKRVATPRDALSESEFAVLVDVALGLTDKVIAERRAMSLRSVQNRLLSLYDKLGVDGEDTGVINKRTRAINRALLTRTLNVETLVSAEREMTQWLAQH